MNTQECQYLLDILENTFRNCCPVALEGDCRNELVSAVAGIDDLFCSLQARIVQQKELTVAVESNIERLENRLSRAEARR